MTGARKLHSPLSVIRNPFFKVEWVIMDSAGEPIAHASDSNPDAESNLQLLVHSSNCHADLLDILTVALYCVALGLILRWWP